jgi:hypothetical protein
VATPVRLQVLVVVGIFAFTAALGGAVYGIRAGLGSLYAEPACAKICAARGVQLVDVDYRVGKNDNHSFCVCSGSVRVEAAEANVVANLSALAPIVLGVASMGVIVWRLSRKKTA